MIAPCRRPYITRVMACFRHTIQNTLRAAGYVKPLKHFGSVANPARAPVQNLSGDPSASEADLRLTRRIVEASRILQLQLHFGISQLAFGRLKKKLPKIRFGLCHHQRIVRCL
jgi:hypothetical protein